MFHNGIPHIHSVIEVIVFSFLKNLNKKMIYYNMLMFKTFSKKIFLLGLMLFSIGAFAQDAEVGMEYMKAGEYEKAKTVFQKVAKNKEAVKSIYKPYLQTLIKLKEYDEAEKFLKKQKNWLLLRPTHGCLSNLITKPTLLYI